MIPVMLQDRVLIEKTSIEQKTSGGIILSEITTSEQPWGKIISLGPDIKDLRLIPDSIILYLQHAGFPFSLNGKEFIILRETDIVLILDKN